MKKILIVSLGLFLMLVGCTSQEERPTSKISTEISNATTPLETADISSIVATEWDGKENMRPEFTYDRASKIQDIYNNDQHIGQIGNIKNSSGGFDIQACIDSKESLSTLSSWIKHKYNKTAFKEYVTDAGLVVIFTDR